MKPGLKKSLALTKRAKDAIRMPYTFPGGYPLSIMLSDGESICPACARREWRNLCEETIKPGWTQWRIVSVDVLWEGSDCCVQCGEDLTAYGNPDDGED